jgi:signal transduction histidine kinase
MRSDERRAAVTVPVWVLDLLVAVAAVAVLLVVRSLEIHYRHLHHTGAAGPLIALVAGLVLALRHRWPLAVCLVAAAAVPLAIGLDRASGADSLPVLIAVYTVATIAPRRRAMLVTLLVAVSLALARGLIQAQGWSDARTSAEPALAIAALFLGWAVAGHRAYIEEIKDRAARAEASREEELRRRLDAERLRIARELHDVVAHSIATINVQAGVAAHVIDKQPEHAAAALTTIKYASKEALRELRNILGILRGPDEDESRAPAPGLAQLDVLVSTSRDAGLAVDVKVTGQRHTLPATVDLAAYRIVQESLTNILRHAGPAKASVRLGYSAEQLEIEISDNGRGAPRHERGGHGIAGMHERAAAFGGDLDAGPQAEGGFRVCARIPLEAGA